MGKRAISEARRARIVEMAEAWEEVQNEIGACAEALRVLVKDPDVDEATWEMERLVEILGAEVKEIEGAGIYAGELHTAKVSIKQKYRFYGISEKGLPV